MERTQTLEEHRAFHAHTDRTAPDSCDFCAGRRPWPNVQQADKCVSVIASARCPGDALSGCDRCATCHCERRCRKACLHREAIESHRDSQAAAQSRTRRERIASMALRLGQNTGRALAGQAPEYGTVMRALEDLDAQREEKR